MTCETGEVVRGCTTSPVFLFWKNTFFLIFFCYFAKNYKIIHFFVFFPKKYKIIHFFVFFPKKTATKLPVAVFFPLIDHCDDDDDEEQ